MRLKEREEKQQVAKGQTEEGQGQAVEEPIAEMAAEEFELERREERVVRNYLAVLDGLMRTPGDRGLAEKVYAYFDLICRTYQGALE